MKSPVDPYAGWKDAKANADKTLVLPGEGGPMFFRRIQAGKFRMGSRGQGSREEPQHTVRIPEPFRMATFPVTQRQFRAFAAARGIEHENEFNGDDRLPVENVNWLEAMQFCEWLSEELKLELGHGSVSLPTEVEWEYACRARTTTEYWSGDGEAALRRVGWFAGNSESRTHVVGELGASARNPWGLYDVHGNVWEWCLDLWDGDAYRSRLDREDDTSRARADLDDRRAIRVIRGGSWADPAGDCRSAYRGWWWPDDRSWFQGFRVCWLPGPVVPESRESAEPTEEAKAQGEGQASGGTTRSRPPTRAEADDLAGTPLVLPPRPASGHRKVHPQLPFEEDS